MLTFAWHQRAIFVRSRFGLPRNDRASVMAVTSRFQALLCRLALVAAAGSVLPGVPLGSISLLPEQLLGPEPGALPEIPAPGAPGAATEDEENAEALTAVPGSVSLP